MFNEQRFTMRSPRMAGADNLYVDPVHIPINYDYVYRERCPVRATTPSTGINHHFGWDNSFDPAERVAPGSTIEFECLDASGGQLTADSTLADVVKLDFGKVNPVTGPIYVEGAEPGDALKVTIEAFKPSGFGWTANIPGFGLLAD